MIITDVSQVLDANIFADGLTRAMNAVVRIQIEGPSGRFRCTGWMVTPGIVMVPEHVAESAARDPNSPPALWIVQGMRDGQVIWQDRGGELIRLEPGASPDVEKPFRIALIVLRKSRKLARLDLSLAMPAPGGFASVLSFPGGQERLMLSLGKLITCNEVFLEYDAGTEGGSSGAPVLDERLQVIGMHMMASRVRNRGVTRNLMFKMLQQMRPWREIAKLYGFADVAADRRELSKKAAAPADRPDEALMRAALRVNVRPGTFSEAQQQLLRPRVVNPNEKMWTLQSNVRQSVIRSAGSLEALRPYAPRNGTRPGQRVISKILAGPPYELAESPEEELSWWIQASRWFSGVAPELPSPADANRVLRRRRVRSRLDAIAGEDFIGRTTELRAMRKWYEREPPVPLCISGVGGVGKSALVARFAASLPKDTLLLWLDFDRADLAPDDAVSVISGLAEQTQVQLDNFTPPSVNVSDWKASARALAQALVARRLERPPLLVLDSFEVAQYAERYQELWPVLEEISTSLSSLRVIVSGRAPMKALKLHGRSAELLPIKGLKPKDSREWLRRNGIRSSRVIEDVIKRSRGLPLVLHLARRLVETGGKVNDLPKKLPPEIIAGFLYDRILDRVQHASLKPLAQGALVLRRLTEDIIRPVLDGQVELPPGEPADWFRDLSREAALVDGTGVLRLRPEVRSAALELLEQEKPDLVRSVDQRAAQWYATQDVNNPEIAAELVYHRLRLGDVNGAKEAWRDGCSLYLQYADEDLEGKAHTWLRARLGSSTVTEAPLEAWEYEAAERIRGARLRGLGRAAAQILKERTERTGDSPLVFHEAYDMRESGQPTAALDHLATSGTASGAVGRERALLQALLLAELGRGPEADAILRPLCTREAWKDRSQGQRELMAVCAARVRMAVDIAAEQEVLLMVEAEGAGVADAIAPIDVALFSLERLLVERLDLVLERSVTLAVSTHDHTSNTRLEQNVEEFRRLITPLEPPVFRDIRRRVSVGETPRAEDWPTQTREAVQRVLLGGWRRWEVLYHAPLFEGSLALLTEAKPGPLDLSIVAAYAFFIGLNGLDVVVSDAQGSVLSLDSLVLDMLSRNKSALPQAQINTIRKEVPIPVAQSSRSGSTSRKAIRELATLLLDATPDPLRLLVNRFAGKERTDG
jgi:hypothetical protein